MKLSFDDIDSENQLNIKGFSSKFTLRIPVQVFHQHPINASLISYQSEC